MRSGGISGSGVLEEWGGEILASACLRRIGDSIFRLLGVHVSGLF